MVGLLLFLVCIVFFLLLLRRCELFGRDYPPPQALFVGGGLWFIKNLFAFPKSLPCLFEFGVLFSEQNGIFERASDLCLIPRSPGAGFGRAN